jgi:hypothetical protein
MDSFTSFLLFCVFNVNLLPIQSKADERKIKYNLEDKTVFQEQWKIKHHSVENKVSITCVLCKHRVNVPKE